LAAYLSNNLKTVAEHIATTLHKAKYEAQFEIQLAGRDPYAS
jgi:hypothetical protein